MYDDITHKYTRKSNVVHTKILLSEKASAEFSDRAVLWSTLEKIEKAKNSQLEIALPVELTQEQNISLVHEYVNRHFLESGICTDICVHDTGDSNSYGQCDLLSEHQMGLEAEKRVHSRPAGGKIYDPKSGNTNANPFPPLTGTSKPESRNGARLG